MKKIILFVFAVGMLSTAFGQRRIGAAMTREEKLNQEYCSGLFNNPQGTYFDFSNTALQSSAMGYRNIIDWLQGRVAGLQVFQSRNNVSVPFIRNQRAAVFINEVPVNFDGASIVSVADIAMVKVMKDPMVAGWRGPGGAILIYTWRGEDEDEE
jgi:hypothetical protein